ncbi:MAG: branched-chain-amino-acid transaminase [Acidobacteria bacterium]|nr:branched-chain-amino-acid transaminase [Acidobacteriota bacterium]
MSEPRTSPPDWQKLGFKFRETDKYYHCHGDLGRDPIWESGEYRPFGEVSLSPAAAFFSYGLGVFEGLKARRAPDGRVLLFRHRDNARRFQKSAERLLMAPFPEDQFAEAVEQVARRNLQWIPPADKGTFYIRPLQHGIEAQVGIRPSSRFWVLIFGCPVASYFDSDAENGSPSGVRLKVLEQGRCAPGGTGAAKVMGNYAGGIAVASPWQRKGYDDVLYLDARHVRFLTETSGSNVFVKLKNGRLITPPLDDQILAGLTRDSVIRIARDKLGVTVEERDIPISEALEDGEEMFCTGTAWSVQPVREINFRDRAHPFPIRELRQAIADELEGIQFGTREDPFGWTTAID